MKGYFFDSSAFFKIYATENGSERVLALAAKAPEIIVSELILPELASALARAIRQKKLPKEAWAAAQGTLAADMRKVRRIPVSSELLEASVRCIEKAELRGADAVHVASAMASGCQLFVSADLEQCHAAHRLGLKVEAIR